MGANPLRRWSSVCRVADASVPQIGCGPEDSVCLLDQVHDGALVPLEWSLSRSARTALDARATSLRGCLP